MREVTHLLADGLHRRAQALGRTREAPSLATIQK
jgi:hypothetical protein